MSVNAAGNEAERLALTERAAAQLQPIALCLSGGGIRSASFGLGVMQALARSGLLTRFLISPPCPAAAISGLGCPPGYIAGDSRAVIRGLAAHGTQENEPEPIHHLRQFSNLTPRPGVLSSDTWAAVAICVRNLLLNWTILFPARYPEPGAAPGKLSYMKSAIRGDERVDIFAYVRENPSIPNQTTGDQWFDEPQFESYGCYAMAWIIESCKR